MEFSSRLQGRVAVVTGSSRGIGLIIAQSLATAGANVVFCARSPDSLATASQHFQAFPETQVLGVTCDVADLDQVEQLAQQTLQRFGQIDIWFNNAAVNRYFGPAFDAPITHWREVIDTNLHGLYHGTWVALKHMLPRQQGKIINMLGAGGSDSPGNSYLSAYTTSKAAARRFTLVVASDYRDTGLSVLGMNPGLFATDLTTKIKPLNDEALRRMKFLSFGLNWLSTSTATISKTAVHIASDATNGKTGKIYRCWPDLWTNWQRQQLRIKTR